MISIHSELMLVDAVRVGNMAARAVATHYERTRPQAYITD